MSQKKTHAYKSVRTSQVTEREKKVNEMNRQFLKEDIWEANKHTKLHFLSHQDPANWNCSVTLLQQDGPIKIEKMGNTEY